MIESASRSQAVLSGRRRLPTGLLLLALGGATAGIVGAFAIVDLAQVAAVMRWPTVPGKILEATKRPDLVINYKRRGRYRTPERFYVNYG